MYTKITRKQFDDFVNWFFVEKLKDGNIRLGKMFLTKFPEINNELLGHPDGVTIWMSANDKRMSADIESKFIRD